MLSDDEAVVVKGKSLPEKFENDNSLLFFTHQFQQLRSISILHQVLQGLAFGLKIQQNIFVWPPYIYLSMQYASNIEESEKKKIPNSKVVGWYLVKKSILCTSLRQDSITKGKCAPHEFRVHSKVYNKAFILKCITKATRKSEKKF